MQIAKWTSIVRSAMKNRYFGALAKVRSASERAMNLPYMQTGHMLNRRRSIAFGLTFGPVGAVVAASHITVADRDAEKMSRIEYLELMN